MLGIDFSAPLRYGRNDNGMNDYARNGTGELRNGTTIRSSVTAFPSLCAAAHFLSSESFLSGIDFSAPLRYGRNDNGMNDYARNGTMRETWSLHFV